MNEIFNKIDDLKVMVEVRPKNNNGKLEFDAVIQPGEKPKVLAALAEVSKDASKLDKLVTEPLTITGGSSSHSSRGGKSRKGRKSKKGGKSRKSRKSLRRK